MRQPASRTRSLFIRYAVAEAIAEHQCLNGNEMVTVKASRHLIPLERAGAVEFAVGAFRFSNVARSSAVNSVEPQADKLLENWI